MAKLYLITGPSGVGKSTISKILANRLSKSVLIEGDDFYNQVVGGLVKPWLEGNHLKLMWKNIIACTKNYLSEGYDVVLNYIIHKDTFKKLLEEFDGYEIHFVLLMASKEVICNRDESRAEDVQVHRTEIHIKNYLNDNYDNRFILYTDNLSPEESVEKLLKSDNKI